MILYTYACCNCWDTFEARRSVAERATATCPKCGTLGVKEFVPGVIRMPHSDWCEMTAREFLDCKRERDARGRVTVTKGMGKVAPRL